MSQQFLGVNAVLSQADGPVDHVLHVHPRAGRDLVHAAPDLRPFLVHCPDNLPSVSLSQISTRWKFGSPSRGIRSAISSRPWSRRIIRQHSRNCASFASAYSTCVISMVFRLTVIVTGIRCVFPCSATASPSLHCCGARGRSRPGPPLVAHPVSVRQERISLPFIFQTDTQSESNARKRPAAGGIICLYFFCS